MCFIIIFFENYPRNASSEMCYVHSICCLLRHFPISQVHYLCVYSTYAFEHVIILLTIILFLQTSLTETSAPELAKLLYWLMVVGYSVRNIEVRFDMERVLGTSPKPAELPPGENM